MDKPSTRELLNQLASEASAAGWYESPSVDYQQVLKDMRKETEVRFADEEL